jgi:glyoxylase-like metal-dependent hydrolase (beta-lactamase superfamily II)
MTKTFSPAPPPESLLSFGPISLLPGKKGGRYPYCHSLILSGEETWVVDPASDKGFLDSLARTGEVTRVFLSHFHEDHLKYAYLFPQATFHVPVQEVEAFTSFEGIFSLTGAENPVFREYLRETLVRDFHFQPFTNLVPFKAGDRFVNGEIILEVIAAPGHTPGHSCFVFPEQDLIFLADVDLTPFGPWYGDAASDLEVYRVTLMELKETQARTYLTAHEQGVFTLDEAQAGLDYFLGVIETRDHQILELLKEPHSLKELVECRPIYGRPREPTLVYDHLEGQMLKKHLDRLKRRGSIEATTEGYVRK